MVFDHLVKNIVKSPADIESAGLFCFIISLPGVLLPSEQHRRQIKSRLQVQAEEIVDELTPYVNN